nr:hypothetical protein [Brevibacterium linens]
MTDNAAASNTGGDDQALLLTPGERERVALGEVGEAESTEYFAKIRGVGCASVREFDLSHHTFSE